MKYNRKMKKTISIFILLSLLFLYAQVYSQKSIHVYSTEIPWKDTIITEEPDTLYSIASAIERATANDSIIIHEGIYREKIVVNKNFLHFKNFKNDYVLISGAEVIKGWSDATGMHPGVKVADVSGHTIETPYTQVFSNGKHQIMARHPNNETGDMMEPMNAKSGYALLSKVSKDAGTNANCYATFAGEPFPNGDLSGAVFRGLTGKMRMYVFGTVSSRSGSKITFKATNSSAWTENAAISESKHKFSWGYVLHKNLIDYPGEWFVDNKKLYFLPKEGADIDKLRIEMQVREKVLVLNSTNGVTLSGIHFTGGNVDMQNTQNVTIDNCSMRYLYPFWTPNGYGQGDTDKKGVYLSNSSNNAFKDTYVAHSWGNMIALHDGSNNSFKNCIIEDFGWVGIFTSAIHIKESDNTNINNCTFGDAGRFQVRIDGGDAKVNIMDCDFYGAMKIGEDAGPIEATSTGWIGALDLKGSVLAYNKIHDCHGVPVTTDTYNRQKVVALYMEDTENYTAHHNLVYNIRANNYTGPHTIDKAGEFLYLGPRYNQMHNQVNYYNNTVWDIDKAIGIWCIEINNWEELNLNFSIGCMKDGHFVNNIMMEGPLYNFNFAFKNLTSTGGWAANPGPHPNPPVLKTTNFNTYVNHCKNQDHHFNPKNNVFYKLADASKNFVDASQGDFNLLSGSTAKNGGISIPGITSSSNPDCGALEGGDRVLNAGAKLTIPKFLEIDDPSTGLGKVLHSPRHENLRIYHNPERNELRILLNFNEKIKSPIQISLCNLQGRVVERRDIYEPVSELMLTTTNFSSGCFIVQIITKSGQRIHKKVYVAQ